MSALGPEARSILNAGRHGDDPKSADRARVRKNLARVLAAGGALGAASAAAAAAAAEGSAAAAGAAAAEGSVAAAAGSTAGGVLTAGTAAAAGSTAGGVLTAGSTAAAGSTAGGVLTAGSTAAAGSTAGGVLTAGVAVATWKALSFALVGKVLGGLFVAGAIVAGVTLARSPSPAPSAASVASLGSAGADAAPAPEAPASSTVVSAQSKAVAEAPSIAPTANALTTPALGPSQAAVSLVAPAPGPAAAAASPKPDATVAPAPPAPVAEDPLEAETRRLREAHGALQSGDPANALKLLDEQAAAYSDGQLREERAAARVLALCKLGKVDEARAAAAAFLRDSPLSPLTGRVRAGCPAPTP